MLAWRELLSYMSSIFVNARLISQLILLVEKRDLSVSRRSWQLFGCPKLRRRQRINIPFIAFSRKRSFCRGTCFDCFSLSAAARSIPGRCLAEHNRCLWNRGDNAGTFNISTAVFRFTACGTLLSMGIVQLPPSV